jgi:type II secretory ATPase GspE/PulE/Tfp pilus assembly ATPase PilB-like protein
MGMKTLIDDAALKAAAGLTTVEEVARVVAAEDRS